VKRNHAVDIAGQKAGVVECGTDRFARPIAVRCGRISLENLVWPMPTMAVFPGRPVRRSTHPRAPSSRLRTGGAGDVIAEAVGMP